MEEKVNPVVAAKRKGVLSFESPFGVLTEAAISRELKLTDKLQ